MKLIYFPLLLKNNPNFTKRKINPFILPYRGINGSASTLARKAEEGGNTCAKD